MKAPHMVATGGPVPLIMPWAPRRQNAFDPAADITSRCSREPTVRASAVLLQRNLRFLSPTWQPAARSLASRSGNMPCKIVRKRNARARWEDFLQRVHHVCYL